MVDKANWSPCSSASERSSRLSLVEKEREGERKRGQKFVQNDTWLFKFPLLQLSVRNLDLSEHCY